MKVAVCISGQPRGNYQAQVQTLRDYFPYDFFFATWSQELCEIDCEYFDAPEMHYNPGNEFDYPEPVTFNVKKIRQKVRQKPNLWLHRTKQILIHDMLLERIPESYDMIIRARFDTKVDTKRPFNRIESMIKSAYDNKRTVGFCTPKNGPNQTLNRLEKLPLGHNRSVQYHCDHMIFHRRDMWDHDRVRDFHFNKKLIGAEYGWYQILSEPYTDKIEEPNHDTYIGFAGIETGRR